MNSEDRDFSYWLSFFKEHRDLEEFKNEILVRDNYFLTNTLNLDFDDENYEFVYPSGFLEKDIHQILDEEEEENKYYHTRFAIALNAKLDFSLLINHFGKEKFSKAVERVLIFGEYENYNIDFVNLLKIAIKKLYIDKSSFIDISFLRGVELGKRN